LCVVFTVADKYRVVAPIAEGGMGAVYEAVHIASGRRVALKLLHQDSVRDKNHNARFIQEARIVRELVSPYVAKVLDSGTDPTSGLPYLVMEYLEGADLHTVIHERTRLPVGLVLVIAAQIAAGLSDAHAAGIVHRDVKPSNVVICSNVEHELVTKLIDFGIAKATHRDGTAMTKTGDFIGSLPYMSPEQLSGERVDARTDIWSLGLVMYEAITGERPTGEDPAVAEVVQRVCIQDIPPIRDAAPWVPPQVAELIHCALRRSRDERFQTAREMHDAIVALLPEGVRHPLTVLDGGEGIAVGAIVAHSNPAISATLPAMSIDTLGLERYPVSPSDQATVPVNVRASGLQSLRAAIMPGLFLGLLLAAVILVTRPRTTARETFQASEGVVSSAFVPEVTPLPPRTAAPSAPVMPLPTSADSSRSMPSMKAAPRRVWKSTPGPAPVKAPDDPLKRM
jgi:serine/threonine-protein kinase